MKKEVLEYLVKAWRSAYITDNKLEMLGFRDTPLFEIAGNIMDAIYYLLDENTRTIDESVTSETLYTDNMSVEECAAILMKHYNNRISTNVSDSIANICADTKNELYEYLSKKRDEMCSNKAAETNIDIGHFFKLMQAVCFMQQIRNIVNYEENMIKILDKIRSNNGDD